MLDEPTNDLDVETLDLLQELIADYDGTVLMVSHDRDFLDRVAATTIAMEGDGRAVIYAGGWSDYRAQRGGGEAVPRKPAKAASKSALDSGPKPEPRRAPPRGLTVPQQKRLADLPAEIDRLGAEIARLEDFLSDPELFAREPVKFRKATEGLAERQARLAAAEEEWLELEELREGTGRS